MTRRRVASVSVMMASNHLLRWLISITLWPLSPYSSSSACACFRTFSGSMLGPALKLYTRAIMHLSFSLSDSRKRRPNLGGVRVLDLSVVYRF